MPGWPGHSFTHLSRFASIFRNAVRHCLNTSRRVTLIAASAIATPAFYSRSLPRRARFRPPPLHLRSLPLLSLPRARHFARAFLSLANRNRSCTLMRTRAHRVIYGGRGPTSGLSINYGQFSSPGFYLRNARTVVNATFRFPRYRAHRRIL